MSKNWTRLEVKNNLIFEGNTAMVLRGMAIADPVRLNGRAKELLKDIVDFGANTVRIPIVPGLFQIDNEYLEKNIDELVFECKRLGIYCILDWHAIGNPIKGETRMKEHYFEKEGARFYEYESNINICKNAWSVISKRYRQENHVIFEIFNEPAPGENDIPHMQLSALFWEDWKKEAENIIDIIRENSKNLILVGSIKWAYDLVPVLKNPIKKENIAYSIHMYPVHAAWKIDLANAIKILPLIITEWGFSESTTQEFMRGTEKEYGLPVLNYFELKKISWIAWCYDWIWDPKMLCSAESKTLTAWGKLIVSHINK
jgi:endoglucanase